MAYIRVIFHSRKAVHLRDVTRLQIESLDEDRGIRPGDATIDYVALFIVEETLESQGCDSRALVLTFTSAPRLTCSHVYTSRIGH